MTISRQSLVDRAYLRLLSAGQEISVLKLDGMVNQSLELLGKGIASGEDYQGLQKSFSLTVTSGVGDLTSLTGALFDICKAIVFPPSSTTRAVPVPLYDDLIHGQLPTDVVYFARTGTSLRFRDTSGSLTGLSGTSTLWANFVPLITEIPTQYEGALVDVLVELASTKPVHAEEMAVGR